MPLTALDIAKLTLMVPNNQPSLTVAQNDFVSLLIVRVGEILKVELGALNETALKKLIDEWLPEVP